MHRGHIIRQALPQPGARGEPLLRRPGAPGAGGRGGGIATTRLEHAIPQRQCAGCGSRRPQRSLVRLVVRNGRVEIDRKRRAGGRGAYLCPDPACARRALRRGSLPRRLRQPVSGLESLEERLRLEPAGEPWKDSV
ncbi:MAG TPA: YlxR family protein [Gaiellales bacterium]|nr:YlxR family protein [Gaiellales bacterium]